MSEKTYLTLNQSQESPEWPSAVDCLMPGQPFCQLTYWFLHQNYSANSRIMDYIFDLEFAMHGQGQLDAWVS